MFKIKQFVSSEICLKCQGCCRFAEQDSIWSPNLLGEEIQELLNNGVPPTAISVKKKICLRPFAEEGNFICSFFAPQSKLCKIYPYRPFECRLYPFLINRRGQKIYLAIDQRCPFARRNLKSKKGKDYVLYLTELFRSPEYSSILRDNPQIIQEYQEVTDIGELGV